MTGYIRADQVTEGMVLDLTSPTSGNSRYFWLVAEATTKVSTYLHLLPHTVDNPRDWEPEHTVRLRHDERVWVTGWGVQPEVEATEMFVVEAAGYFDETGLHITHQRGE